MRTVLVWGLLGLGCLSGTLFAADGGLTAEMLVDLKTVRQAAMSPDGERVAYLLRVQRDADDEPGGPYVELWLAGMEGAPRHFAGTEESISDVAWSPDGARVTFLSDRNGDPENERKRLYAISADGGEARALLDHPGSISLHRWSPDGARIAFVARDADTEEEKEAEQAGRDWKVHDENQKFGRLWVLDPESGETHQVFDRDLDVADVVWSPDGRALFFQAAESTRIDDEYMFSKIWRVSNGGRPEVVTSTEGKLGPMAASPDGGRLAFLGATSLDDPLAQSLFVVAARGGESKNLTDGLGASASDLLWLDEDSLLLVAVEETRHVLYRFDATSGDRAKMDWPGWIVGDLNRAAKHDRLAVVAQSPGHPNELFVYEPRAGAPRRISYHNPGLDEARLARQEVVRWTGAAGVAISGVLTYPLDYRTGKRYPLVLQVHGGPEGASLDGWTSSALYPVQLLAARGYVVLQPNYRGSQGRGVAFSKGDHDDLGGREFEDILRGIDALADRGLIDPDRVGTGGWSYGGYMSAWAATRHSDRFKASVVAAGLTNWIAFAGTTDIPYEMSLVHWSSWWFDEPELHWRRSPLAHIGNAKTPTLIVHGARDDRVHPEQGLELYTALRIKDVPTRFVVYPREPHGLNERAHQLDFIERVLDWFDTHLD